LMASMGLYFLRFRLDSSSLIALFPLFALLGSRSNIAQEPGHECRPTSLVAGTNAAAGVAVEIFVEENQVFPGWVMGEAIVAAVARSAASGVGEEDLGEADFQFVGDLLQVHQMARAGRTFDFQAVAVEMEI